MISIIIPVYNQAEKLIKALESIARQTYLDYEVIIVNDGSSDGVEMLFAKYYEKLNSNHKYLFLNKVHSGAPATRNYGYQKAQGNYLLFCDADVVLKNEALEIMLKTLEANPDTAYAYASFYWGRKLFKVGEFNPDRLRNEPYIHASSLIRRADFPESAWDENIKKFQDWDLWLTMLEQGKKGIWINQVLLQISTGGTISSWLPSCAYRWCPFLPVVKKYNLALKIIKEKHGLK